MLEDEELPPEQPAFTALFLQAIFKSLLHKAINTAQLGSSSTETAPSSSHDDINPLFVEPSRPVDSIPILPLFLDVVKKQWTMPGSVPVPSSMDRKNFNVAPA